MDFSARGNQLKFAWRCQWGNFSCTFLHTSKFISNICTYSSNICHLQTRKSKWTGV